MKLKEIKCLLILAFFGILFIACSDDDKTVEQEELNAFVSGKYFCAMESGTWLKKSGNNLYEVSDPHMDGMGPIMTNEFWFTDDNILITNAVIDESAPIETSLSFRWGEYLYEKGEELTLFVRSNYRYDPSTGRFSTDNQSLVREKAGSAYYIERTSGKEITLRIEFKEPAYEDLVGLRITCQEYLLPDLRPDFHYKIFDSNEEAIAYVKERLEE